jgi:hypothetical protein
MKPILLTCLFCTWALIAALPAVSTAQSMPPQVPRFFDDQPQSSAPPASLGQQPFVVEKEPDLTPSQTNTNQLNQLFISETTPDICAAGEEYVTGSFTFLRFRGQDREYRYQLQGQYGFTDQIAAGAYVPGITAKQISTDSGLGDITVYAQYKLDQFINPEIVDMTAQVDMVLPTGNRTELRDTGKFGVRPLILAYKDFGQRGPGILGAYGSFGFTLTTNSDVRLALAATYQLDRLTGILEFYDQTGSHQGGPQVELTPGFAYKGVSPWEFSVGVPIGLNKGSPDWGVVCKLTYVFQN